MGEEIIDLADWARADTYRWFRSYQQPHYAVTARVDVTRIEERCARGLSSYRACLWAIGAGLHAVPDLRVRFRGDRIVRHDRIALSFTVPRDTGGFAYSYQPWDADRARFDADVQETIARVRAAGTFDARDETASDAVAYLSCLPWLDFTALTHAVPGPDDCIPRVSWGRIVPEGDRYAMAVNIQVHHAVTDGEHLGAFFEALQAALNAV